MKIFLGYLLITAGVLLGIYTGLWLVLLHGLVEIATALKADEIIPKDLAVGIVKVSIAVPIFLFWLFMGFVIGGHFIRDGQIDRFKNKEE